MLILNQMGNKLINLDRVESIEIGYDTGSTYTVKAILERGWNDPAPHLSDYGRCTIKLGEYATSPAAEEVIRNIYFAYDSKCQTFHMPKVTAE